MAPQTLVGIWALLRPVLSLLLAFSTTTKTKISTNIPRRKTTSPARAIINDIRSTLHTLLSPEPLVCKHYKSTIRFIHVSPRTTALKRWNISAVRYGDNALDAQRSIFRAVASRHNFSKPVALYLPGMDGIGMSAHWQFSDLSQHFEFWRMSIDAEDRSTFPELVEAVVHFLDDVVNATNVESRDIVLIGESSGGVLAPAVALSRKVRLKGLVLVNPATSFTFTHWSTTGPLLTMIGNLEGKDKQRKLGWKGSRACPVTFYSILGGIILASRIPDSKQFNFIVERLIFSPSTSDDLHAVREGLGILVNQFPAPTVEHRIHQWLLVGNAVVNPRLSSLDLPTLIIAGGQDNILPSKNEATRLAKEIVHSTLVKFDSSGHIVLDERVNLTRLILNSDIFPIENYDPIVDWKLPSIQETRDVIEQRVRPLRSLTSPSFFSTDEEGRRHKGLSRVPSAENGPLLVVANHQFVGVDVPMIVSQLMEDRGIYVRGLAHPVVFQSPEATTNSNNERTNFGGVGGGGGLKGQFGVYKRFGAVRVSPRNYYRLLQSGQATLLFPGGVREAFHGKDEAYQLFWPSNGKIDFVRVAAKFNATIVPLSAIGAADSVNILVDAPDMLTLPFGLGERIANTSRNVMAARFDSDNEMELFASPFVLPKPLPARHYYLFGRPVDTSNIDHRDREACKCLYLDLKKEIERGFDDLLRAREKDPFGNTAPRLAYELFTGKAAPTFDMVELR